MYALSTVLFNHGAYFRQFRPTDPQWLPLWEKDYTVAVPEDKDALRQTAQQILTANGLNGGFFAQKQGQRLNINVQNFWHPKRVVYDIAAGKLRAEEKKFAWVELFARLHQRVGYGAEGWLNKLWAVFVDIFCVTTLVWIGTGLYLWWKLPMTRNWGWLAIGGGITSIVVLILNL